MTAVAPAPETPSRGAGEAPAGRGPALSATGLAKSFGATRALRDFSFEFARGRAYALVGENGSGKSTFVKVLCGVLPADRGALTIADRSITRFSPRTAMSAGVATCHQEILVEDNLSTLANLFLWDRGWIRPQTKLSARRKAAREVLDELSLHPPPLDWRVEHLSLAARQLVVIARTMLQEASVLLFDEVTAALDQSDADRVLGAMRKRASAGDTVLFTTHRMEELQRLGDEIIVLRNGEIAGVLSSAELSAERVLKLMSGRTVSVDVRGQVHSEVPAVEGEAADDQGPEKPAEREPLAPVPTGRHGKVALRLTQTTLATAAPTIELDVRWGEITGLAGLDGHGQTDLLKLMGGVEIEGKGSVELAEGEGFVSIKGQRQAVDLGVTYLPRDRKTQGIFPTLSVLENFALPTAAQRTTLGFTSRRQTVEEYEPLADRLAVKAASRDAGISSLSGGNQQKILLARWLAAKPRVVLLDDPTRGVDIGTKLDLYKLLSELAAEDRAVVIVSTELEELSSLCDRVLVLHKHGVSADLRRGESAPVERQEILAAMMGNWQEGR